MLQAQTELLWDQPATAEVRAQLRDGAWILSDDGTLSVVEVSGATRWINVVHDDSTHRRFSRVGVRSDGVIVASRGAETSALDHETGEILWQRYYWHDFAIDRDDTLIAVGFDHLHRIAPDGSEIWTTDFAGADPERPVIAPDGTIYLTVHHDSDFDYETDLTAVSPEGEILWYDRLPRGRQAGEIAPRPSGGVIAANFPDLALVAYAGDGQRDWEVRLESLIGDVDVVGLAVGSDGEVVLSTSAFDVLWFAPDGSLLEQAKIGSTSTGPWLMEDGRCAVNEHIMNPDGSVHRVIFPRGEHAVFGRERFYLSSSGERIRLHRLPAGADEAAWGGRTGFAGGTACASGRPDLPPEFVLHPRGQMVQAGNPITLRVVAKGTGPLIYEWLENGVPIPGEPKNWFSLKPARDGVFVCRVTGVGRSVDSDPAVIETGEPAVGELAWDLGNLVICVPAEGLDGTIYAIGQMERNLSSSWLWAVHPAGHIVWQRRLEQYFNTKVDPLFAAGPLITDLGDVVLQDTHSVVCVRPDGTARWRTVLPHSTDVNPMALDRGNRIVVHRGSHLHVLDGATGAQLWQREDTNPRLPSVVIDRDGRIIVQTSLGLTALTSTGAVVWSRPFQEGDGDPHLIGAEGECIMASWDILRGIGPGGNVLWSRSSEHTLPVLLDSRGHLICEQIQSSNNGGFSFTLPYRGVGRRTLPIALPGAVSAGGLVVSANRTEIAAATPPDGSVLNNRGIGRGIITRGGLLISGGNRLGEGALAAWYVDGPLAPSPWPAVHADSRNTRRAPATFTFAYEAIPQLSPGSQHQIIEGDTLALQPDVFAGPDATFHWELNGAVVDGEAGHELIVPSATVGRSGNYKLSIHQAGYQSTSFEVQVRARGIFPGYYASWRPTSTDGSLLGSGYLLRVETNGLWSYVARRGITGVSHERYGSVAEDGSFRVSESDPYVLVRNVDGVVADGVSRVTWFEGLGARLVAPPSMPVRPGFYLGQRSFHSLTYTIRALVGPDGTIFMDAAGGPLLAGRVREGPVYIPFAPAVIDPPYAVTVDGGMLRFTRNDGFSDDKMLLIHEDDRPRLRLVNESTRGYCIPGGEPMIAGFVVGGTERQRLVIRAVGPSLIEHGVTGAASSTLLRIYDMERNLIAENEGWSNSVNAALVANLTEELGAFPLAVGSGDSAMILELDPGAYTAHVLAETGGIALVEVYDAAIDEGSERSERLANLSTRGHVASGERSLIAGFVVTGSFPKTLLVRGVGRSLEPLGVSNAAQDVVLDLYDAEQNLVYSVDDWESSNDVALVGASVGAFPLEQGVGDAAVVIMLPPGLYTAVLSAKSGAEGTGLVEVYEVIR